MSVFRFTERPKSRGGTSKEPTQVREYKAAGAHDPDYVKAYAYALTPSAITTNEGILYRQDINLESVGHKLFYISVPYGKRKNETGQWTWEFDSTGGSFHINVSKSQVAKYPTGAGTPESNQLIGVHGDDVTGADIVIPANKITVSYKHPLAVFSLNYAFSLSAYTGFVNNATFLTRPAGEILFLGLRGSDGTEAEASVSYMFAHEANLQDGIVGTITGIAKQGWDIADVRWEDDDTGGKANKKPLYVYIHRVYERTDLAALLGFGG